MMKKIITLILVAILAGACLPQINPFNSAPTANAQPTIQSMVLTASAGTATVQPSPTPVSVTNTATFTEISPAPSFTPAPNLTTTPATSTSERVSPTSTTTTEPLPVPGTITLTPTLGVLTYGTLPPAVPWSKVTLINKSKAQAYISLQLNNTPAAGAILEYPVRGTVKIEAPVGSYVYVVWVGGRQLTGSLRIYRNLDLTIIIYKDKIIIL